MNQGTKSFEELPSEVARLSQKIDRLENLIANNLQISEPGSDVLNLKEACEFLNLARSTIYGLVNRREIPYSKQRNRLYFSKDRLRSWLLANEKPTEGEAQSEAIENMQKLHSNDRH